MFRPTPWLRDVGLFAAIVFTVIWTFDALAGDSMRAISVVMALSIATLVVGFFIPFRRQCRRSDEALAIARSRPGQILEVELRPLPAAPDRLVCHLTLRGWPSLIVGYSVDAQDLHKELQDLMAWAKFANDRTPTHA